MPGLKRKRTTRRPRRVNTIRRYMRRRRPLRRAVNIGRTPIKYVKEQGIEDIPVLVGTSGVTQAYAFTLAGSLTNYTEFTQLFDQYRLKSVMMKIRLVQPPEANNTSSTSQYYPDIVVAVDHDDNTVPSGYDTIQQYGKSKQGILKPDKWFTYKCRPTAAVMLYRTATTTAYGPASYKQWYDCNNIDIPFYGVKLAVKYPWNLQTAQTLVEVRAVTIWEFKNSR